MFLTERWQIKPRIFLLLHAVQHGDVTPFVSSSERLASACGSGARDDLEHYRNFSIANNSCHFLDHFFSYLPFHWDHFPLDSSDLCMRLAALTSRSRSVILGWSDDGLYHIHGQVPREEESLPWECVGVHVSIPTRFQAKYTSNRTAMAGPICNVAGVTDRPSSNSSIGSSLAAGLEI